MKRLTLTLSALTAFALASGGAFAGESYSSSKHYATTSVQFYTWDPAREALLRSYLLQLRLGSRFWPDAVRLHPAARGEAGEEYGALAA